MCWFGLSDSVCSQYFFTERKMGAVTVEKVSLACKVHLCASVFMKLKILNIHDLYDTETPATCLHCVCVFTWLYSLIVWLFVYSEVKKIKNYKEKQSAPCQWSLVRFAAQSLTHNTLSVC